MTTAALCSEPVPMWRAETMPADLDLKVRTETLVGPVHGYFLACYSVETSSGFQGYAKVHVQRPTCVWGPRAALAKYTAGPCASSELAIEAVVALADIELAKRDTRANRLYRYVLKFL
jgi:hypothetical protein